MTMPSLTAHDIEHLSSITLIHDASGTWDLFVSARDGRDGLQMRELADPFECVEKIVGWLAANSGEHTLPFPDSAGGSRPLTDGTNQAPSQSKAARPSRPRPKTREPRRVGRAV